MSEPQRLTWHRSVDETEDGHRVITHTCSLPFGSETHPYIVIEEVDGECEYEVYDHNGNVILSRSHPVLWGAKRNALYALMGELNAAVDRIEQELEGLDYDRIEQLRGELARTA